MCVSVTAISHTPTLYQPQQKTPSRSLVARPGCVLCRSELSERSLVRPLPALLHAVLYRLPSMYGCVVELHSLPHRIAIRYRRRFSAYSVAVESLQTAARHAPNIRTYACIQDMRSFSERRRWAMILGLETYRDAWLAGVVWSESNSCKASAAQLASVSEEIIPESPKRDRSTSLPSRE